MTSPQPEAVRLSGSVASHYCGQTQAHGAHVWQTPQVYGVATFISTYQCGGFMPMPVSTESQEGR